MTARSCIECGELVDVDHGARCSTCRPAVDRSYIRKPKPRGRRQYSRSSGWRALSERARRLQPWCSDCGSPVDLTLEHTAETHERQEAGLPVGLDQTGGVLCRSCNASKGDPRDQ